MADFSDLEHILGGKEVPISYYLYKRHDEPCECQEE